MITTRYVIVGGGIAGLSTAWALAELGEREIVLLEREPAVGRVSSRRNAAILRTLTPDPAVSAFARESAAFLRDPPRGFCAEPLLDPCGLLLGADGEAALELERQSRACADAAEFERVSAARARELAPHHDAPRDTRLWFAREGRLENERLLDAFLRGARGAGVDVRCAAALSSVERRGAGYELRATERRDARRELVVRCDVLVLASGAWAAAHGRELGSRIELRVTQRHLYATRGSRGVPARAPVVWCGSDPFYARTDGDGLLLSPCDETDVEAERATCDPLLRAQIARKAARWIPRVELGAARHYWAGLRAFTRDGESFCIGWDPDVASLFWIAGLAGHGMSCGPSIGRLAARLLRRDEGGTFGCGSAFARAFDPRRLVARAAPDPRA